jgi:hypothetical protein
MPVMGTPGERRLDRPPSDRYRAAAEAAPEPASGSAPRALGAALAASAGWVALTVLLGGVLAVSAGLLVLAAAFGRLIGLAGRWGAGDAVPRPTRVGIVLGCIVVGFVLGQLGLWAYARAEGGALAPLDYLAQTFGLVVPLQLLVAGVVGWWTAR